MFQVIDRILNVLTIIFLLNDILFNVKEFNSLIKQVNIGFTNKLRYAMLEFSLPFEQQISFK